MWFVVLAFGAILGLAAIWSIKQKRSFPQNIPVVEPWYPLIGNGLLFLGKNDKDKFQNLVKICAGKDGLFRLYLGPKVFFGTGDPDMAQKIMTNPNCIDKPYMYDYFHHEKGVLFAKSARYAMISMKIMFVYLLKRYRFKTKIREEDMRFRFEAILRLDGGHLVQIEKRQ
ncbi:hypothetical protein RP20_CCG007745 [Aedes albopictus]|nr:hypothetical protein RP20_CCG007745 [Aedes albopictus]